MGKVVIPLFNQRVSPRFDCARGFLLASVENGEMVACRNLSAAGWARRERIEKLIALGIDILICGGIDKHSARLLSRYHVRLYTWVTGMAEDALRSFLKGELESCTMIGSGGRSRGRWRFRGRHP